MPARDSAAREGWNWRGGEWGAHPVDCTLLGTLFILIKHVLQNELLLGLCACGRACRVHARTAGPCAFTMWTTCRRRARGAAPPSSSFWLNASPPHSALQCPLTWGEGQGGRLALKHRVPSAG